MFSSSLYICPHTTLNSLTRDMASFSFLKLDLECLHHFAWPLLALGYPICASVQAIETGSYDETRDLISYWILLSLIYLFEHAFLRLLQWFQFWPYIKLMIILCLITPDFGRASYVYNKLIRSYISGNPQAIICRLNNCRKLFVNKDDSFLHAERYMEENGTEALEKPISSKDTAYKPDAEGTSVVRAIDGKEMQQTGEKLQTEPKDIKDLDVFKKKVIPAGKQDIPVMPNFSVTSKQIEAGGQVMSPNVYQEEVPSIFPHKPVIVRPINWTTSSATVKNEGISVKGTADGEVPQSCTQKEVQKEWTCALCKYTTTSDQTLKDHLYGKKHRAIWKVLEVKDQPVGKNRFKLRCTVCMVTCHGVVDMNSHLKGKQHLAQVQSLI